MEGNKRVPKMKHPSTYVNVDKINELEKELKRYKENEKLREENYKKDSKWKRSYTGICSTLTEAARKLGDYNRDLSKPEKIYELLTNIIGDFAGKVVHSAYKGTYRNNGIKVIIEQLNKLQEDLIFQDKYKVIYTRPKKQK